MDDATKSQSIASIVEVDWRRRRVLPMTAKARHSQARRDVIRAFSPPARDIPLLRSHTFVFVVIACLVAAALDVSLNQGQAETIALRCTSFADAGQSLPREFTVEIDGATPHPWAEGERYAFDGLTRYAMLDGGRARFDRRTGTYALQRGRGQDDFVDAAICRRIEPAR